MYSHVLNDKYPDGYSRMPENRYNSDGLPIFPEYIFTPDQDWIGLHNIAGACTQCLCMTCSATLGMFPLYSAITGGVCICCPSFFLLSTPFAAAYAGSKVGYHIASKPVKTRTILTEPRSLYQILERMMQEVGVLIESYDNMNQYLDITKAHTHHSDKAYVDAVRALKFEVGADEGIHPNCDPVTYDNFITPVKITYVNNATGVQNHVTREALDVMKELRYCRLHNQRLNFRSPTSANIYLDENTISQVEFDQDMIRTIQDAIKAQGTYRGFGCCGYGYGWSTATPEITHTLSLPATAPELHPDMA